MAGPPGLRPNRSAWNTLQTMTMRLLMKKTFLLTPISKRLFLTTEYYYHNLPTPCWAALKTLFWAVWSNTTPELVFTTCSTYKAILKRFAVIDFLWTILNIPKNMIRLQPRNVWFPCNFWLQSDWAQKSKVIERAKHTLKAFEFSDIVGQRFLLHLKNFRGAHNRKMVDIQNSRGAWTPFALLCWLNFFSRD